MLADQDDVFVQSTEQTQASRISGKSEQLLNGTCSLKIDAVREEDFGMWSCTLVDATGAVLTAELEVGAGESSLRDF